MFSSLPQQVYIGLVLGTVYACMCVCVSNNHLNVVCPAYQIVDVGGWLVELMGWAVLQDDAISTAVDTEVFIHG